jgi:hypothetical protein
VRARHRASTARPSSIDIKMDAEIGLYQDDFEPPDNAPPFAAPAGS